MALFVTSWTLAPAALVAQTPASVVRYGSPCPSGSVALGYSGMPQIGTTFTVESAFLSGVPYSGSYFEWLLVGPGPANVALPPLGIAAGGQCTILVAIDAILAPTSIASGWPIAVPNQSSLIGVELYAQRVHAWSFWMVSVGLSEGLRLRVGV